jgi:hypothetical protein
LSAASSGVAVCFGGRSTESPVSVGIPLEISTLNGRPLLRRGVLVGLKNKNYCAISKVKQGMESIKVSVIPENVEGSLLLSHQK